jgi:hypothetical protein
MRHVAVIALTFVAFGCIPPQPPVRYVSTFNDTEYQRYAGPGTGNISGVAFLKTRGGEVKVGAGSTVTLDPATTYAREWFTKEGSAWRTHNNVPPDPRFVQFRRTTVCDHHGRFKFTNLPAGRYYVRSTVTWETPVVHVGLLGSVTTMDTQGGVVSSEVDVADGATQEVVLTWASN